MDLLRSHSLYDVKATWWKLMFEFYSAGTPPVYSQKTGAARLLDITGVALLLTSLTVSGRSSDGAW
jgi:hypothetical protein